MAPSPFYMTQKFGEKNNMAVTVERVVQGPIGANTYIVTDEATKHAVIIDAGDCSLELLEKIKDKKVEAILLTHGHFDHILGIKALKEKTGAPICIHEKDEICLRDNTWNLSETDGNPMDVPIEADRLLKEGDKIRFGESELTVLHTPGHTRGGVTYMDSENHLLFTGDTLFCITAGRTDFIGGSFEELMASLIRLSRLPGDYIVYPGHNRDTTLERERTHNRYMRRISK